MDEIDRRLYRAGRALLDPFYDPNAQLLEGKRGDNVHVIRGPIHVHPIRESLQYAVILLASPYTPDHRRAEEIIKAGIAAQDRRPKSDLRGVFKYYLEDDWNNITYPDRNWADFCGTWLLVSGREYGSRLSKGCLKTIKESFQKAAEAVRRRDMGPHYTNIASLGTFVTLIGGEWLGDEGLQTYGISRLDSLVHHVHRNGGSFEEFNSPTYSRVTMTALLLLRWLTQNAAVKEWTEGLLDLLWESISLHYHPCTGQLAGPHSRGYQVIGLSSFEPFLYKVTGGKLGMGRDNDVPKVPAAGIASILPMYCPKQAVDTLLSKVETRTVHEVVQVEGARDADSTMTGFTQLTTFLTDNYCIGSASRSIMWDQRRPLLAYWRNVKEICYLRGRFLKDESDFCSGRLFCVQHRNRILCAATMVKGADSHISFPVQEFEASSLGLAFDVFHGSSPLLSPTEVGFGREAHFDCGTIQISILPAVCLSNLAVGECVLEEHPGLTRIRIDVYRGPPRRFLWSDLSQVGIAVGVSVCGRIREEDLHTRSSSNELNVVWIEEPEMELSIPTNVVHRRNFSFAYKATIGGRNYGPWSLRRPYSVGRPSNRCLDL